MSERLWKQNLEAWVQAQWHSGRTRAWRLANTEVTVHACYFPLLRFQISTYSILLCSVQTEQVTPSIYFKDYLFKQLVFWPQTERAHLDFAWRATLLLPELKHTYTQSQTHSAAPTQISSLPFSFLQRVANESRATVASDFSSAVRSLTITCMMRPRWTWASNVVLHGGYIVGFFCLYTWPFSVKKVVGKTSLLSAEVFKCFSQEQTGNKTDRTCTFNFTSTSRY